MGEDNYRGGTIEGGTAADATARGDISRRKCAGNGGWHRGEHNAGNGGRHRGCATLGSGGLGALPCLGKHATLWGAGLDGGQKSPPLGWERASI